MKRFWLEFDWIVPLALGVVTIVTGDALAAFLLAFVLRAGVQRRIRAWRPSSWKKIEVVPVDEAAA